MNVCVCVCMLEFFLNVEKCLDGVSLPQSGKREVVKSGR